MNFSMSAPVPPGIETKQSLMAAVAELLTFPDYFGWNWDAFDERIRDLSWLPRGSVFLVHSDLPFANDFDNARIYLAILHDAVGKMPKSKNHSLTVVFPEEFPGADRTAPSISARSGTKKAVSCLWTSRERLAQKLKKDRQ